MPTAMSTRTPSPIATSTHTPPPRTPDPTIKPTNAPSTGGVTPPLPTPTSECQPTNQDAFVYFDWRFSVLAACVHVSGVVRRAFVNTGDGDGLIDLELDEPYRRYLTPGNRKVVSGYLHMEVVCYGKPPYKESWATEACANNPNPMRAPLPKVGQRIWAEGRLVQDLFHEELAELHPLYRWSLFK
jgi:hypothetical protein